jgi:sulfite exporter TauE/SafE
MTQDLTLYAAFLIGLVGSVHCIGMCGGIVGALTMGLPAEIRESRWRMLPLLLCYNAGRITSYAVAGTLLGALSGGFAAFGSVQQYPVGRIIAAVFMIMLGTYLAGWSRFLVVLEKGGARLWRYIEPLGRRVLPIHSVLQALMLGLVWGWLPCGMVYATLAWSLTSGSALQGGLLMVAFGLGTLPMLLFLGGAAGWLGEGVRRPVVRRFAGLVVIGFGIYSLLMPFLGGGKPSHPHHHMSTVIDTGKPDEVCRAARREDTAICVPPRGATVTA